MNAPLPADARLPRNPRRRAVEQTLQAARDYDDWKLAAQRLDELSGRARWKHREQSGLYDYVTVRERLDRLRHLLRTGNSAGLIFAIEEGVHGNLGGIGKPILYSKARFGTKQLINDYIDALSDTLLWLEAQPGTTVSDAVKHDLFSRANHCNGRSALMLSAGGTLVYFHYGVARALLQQNLLPRVISGSSAGAMVAAVLGTRTDEELKHFLRPQNVIFGDAWQPGLIERATGLRPVFRTEAFAETFERLIPDLTFREAYERTGRQISISVSPCVRHHSPRLLNALTSPHVLIRSAVRASCAVPGVFEPVQLEARDPDGTVVPYLNARWVDGLFAADLPARQLSRLYGANHFIVSMINPISLPIFRDHKLDKSALQPLLQMVKTSARNALQSADQLLARYLPSSSLGVTNKLIQDLLAQQYVGDISITPSRRLNSPLKLLSPFTLEEVDALMRDGERQTWPRLEMIRVCTKTSRTLDAIVERRGEDPTL